jgi:TrmH family RNA methyltransferase
MLSNRQIKLIQSLKQKKFRIEHQLFVAEGEKIAAEILENQSFEVETVFATKGWIEENQSSIKSTNEICEVSEKELSKISFLTTPNQVLLLLKMSTVTNHQPDWTIAIEKLQDPGNLGTIIRIADWFGISQIILSEDSVDVYNPKVVQATMGSIARVAVEYHDLEKWLSTQKRPIYAAALGGESLYQSTFDSTGVLLLGNESKGLSDSMINNATHSVEIPKRGGAESLNVSVACSVFASEIMRQISLR